MMEQEQQLENTEIEEEKQYLYMIFQYGVDSYYLGTVEQKQLNDGSYAFNILYPVSIFLDEENRYMICELNNLGDANYPLNLNKKEVIAIFTPNDNIVMQYESMVYKIQTRALEKLKEDETNEQFIDENSIEPNEFIYEVKKIQ